MLVAVLLGVGVRDRSLDERRMTILHLSSVVYCLFSGRKSDWIRRSLHVRRDLRFSLVNRSTTVVENRFHSGSLSGRCFWWDRWISWRKCSIQPDWSPRSSFSYGSSERFERSESSLLGLDCHDADLRPGRKFRLSPTDSSIHRLRFQIKIGVLVLIFVIIQFLALVSRSSAQIFTRLSPRL